jgi:hypothetical protein
MKGTQFSLNYGMDASETKHKEKLGGITFEN